MRLSEMIVDLHDDPRGAVLRQIFPTPEDLPPLVKEAALLSPAELEGLPDDAFAAVMIGPEGEKLRKYAMVDEAHLALSTAYLLHRARDLPEGLTKTAAENLAKGWEDFGLEVPEDLEPLRSGVKGRYLAMEKAPEPEVSYTPQRTLLEDRYPVDSLEQVKTAADYFRERYWDFPLSDRRTYAVKLAERMEELGLEIPEEVAQYAHRGRNALLGELLQNRAELAPEEFRPAAELLQKEASWADDETLIGAIEAFDRESGLDQRWNVLVPDPLLTVYGPGREKVADDRWFYNKDGYLIREDHLKGLLEHPDRLHWLKRAFGPDWLEKFRKGPRKAFEGLSDRCKAEVARLALEP